MWDLKFRKHIFTVKVVRHWKGLPRSALGSPSLEILESDWRWSWAARAGLGPDDLQRSLPPPPRPSCDSVSIPERCTVQCWGERRGWYSCSDCFKRIRSELRWTSFQCENSQSVINLYTNRLVQLGSLRLIYYFKSNLSFHLDTHRSIIAAEERKVGSSPFRLRQYQWTSWATAGEWILTSVLSCWERPSYLTR